MNSRIEVEIFGEKIYLVTPENDDTDYIKEIADYVDSKMSEIFKLKKANTRPFFDCMLLGINIADDLFKKLKSAQDSVVPKNNEKQSITYEKHVFLEKRINELENQLNSEKENNLNLRKGNEKLKLESLNKANEIQSIKQEMSAKSEETEAYRLELEIRNQELDAIASALDAKNDEIERLEADLERKLKENKLLKQSLASIYIETEVIKKSDSSKKNSNQSNKRKTIIKPEFAKDEDIISLDKAREVNSIIQNLTNKSKEVDSLKQTLDSKAREMDSLKTDLSNKTKEVDHLKSNLDNKTLEVEAVKKEFDEYLEAFGAVNG